MTQRRAAGSLTRRFVCWAFETVSRTEWKETASAVLCAMRVAAAERRESVALADTVALRKLRRRAAAALWMWRAEVVGIAARHLQLEACLTAHVRRLQSASWTHWKVACCARRREQTLLMLGGGWLAHRRVLAAFVTWHAMHLRDRRWVLSRRVPARARRRKGRTRCQS